MANPLDRTWYNTLIDDDGSGTVGTIWNKGQVDGLLDTVDASLAGLLDKTGGAADQVAIFQDADSLRASPAFTHDGNTLATASVASTPGLIVQKAPGIPTQPTLRLAGQSPSLELLNGTVSHNWFVGLDQADADAFVIGGGAVPPGLTQVLKLRKTNEVVLPYGRLQFPVTANPSADPNTFDDYRERSWVPRIRGTGGESGQTYVKQAGRSCKTGKRVECWFTLIVSVIGTVNGNLAIGDLPYTAEPGSVTIFTSTAFLYAGIAGGYAVLASHLVPGDNFFTVWGGAAGGQASVPGSALTNSTTIHGTLSYMTSD